MDTVCEDSCNCFQFSQLSEVLFCGVDQRRRVTDKKLLDIEGLFLFLGFKVESVEKVPKRHVRYTSEPLVLKGGLDLYLFEDRPNSQKVGVRTPEQSRVNPWLTLNKLLIDRGVELDHF